MTRADWLALGLKLLGVYFLVDGLARFSWAVLTLLQSFPREADWGASSMFRMEAVRTLAYAAIYIGGGFVLVFCTALCVRMIAGKRNEPPSESQMTRPESAVSGVEELPNWPRG
jgi:hypothetical protein